MASCEHNSLVAGSFTIKEEDGGSGLSDLIERERGIPKSSKQHSSRVESQTISTMRAGRCEERGGEE